jgi:hypothetical protein
VHEYDRRDGGVGDESSRELESFES